VRFGISDVEIRIFYRRYRQSPPKDGSASLSAETDQPQAETEIETIKRTLFPLLPPVKK
jgi:hypothetical protein